MGCNDGSCNFVPMKKMRREAGDMDVVIDMKYCGVCHSDLTIAAGHLKGLTRLQYPCVPGHELSGVVVKIGSGVTTFSVGDHAGVGCMVDSCLKCDRCLAGNEQLCSKQIATYQGKDVSGRAAMADKDMLTCGGYTSKMVVHERFCIKIPKSYPLDKAGPIMCSGVTMYEPLQTYGAKEGTRVGIVGLGGLGVIGVKIAKALGCVVTAFSRTEKKKEFALSCGADAYAIAGETVDPPLDLIINTIPVNHDTSVYTKCLANDGKGVHVVLGLHASALAAMTLAKLPFVKFRVKFSAIGGIKNTQAVIDLCAKHDIFPETELHPVDSLNRLYELLDSTNESGKRYVLDIANSLNENTFENIDTSPPTELADEHRSVTLPAILKESVKLAASRSNYL